MKPQPGETLRVEKSNWIYEVKHVIEENPSTCLDGNLRRTYRVIAMTRKAGHPHLLMVIDFIKGNGDVTRRVTHIRKLSWSIISKGVQEEEEQREQRERESLDHDRLIPCCMDPSCSYCEGSGLVGHKRDG